MHTYREKNILNNAICTNKGKNVRVRLLKGSMVDEGC
jgi:hypothetical protein